MPAIRVLIADDHGIVRAGIRSLLESCEDIEVVGEAADGWEAIEQAIRLRPDVVLMDIAMPRLRGVEATYEIRQRLPRVRVLALTVHDREEYFFAMLKAGGSGYVLKEGEPEELLAAIRAAYRGDAYLSPAVTRAILDDYLGRQGEQLTHDDDRLTLRQKEVLQLVVEGKSTREIAEILCLSVKTVEKHRSNIMRKLGLQNWRELMRYAVRKGLIELELDEP
ncbi:MAG TPA: response regulator transcription factor [Caldilineae bacterium]|nr:response regulator transcription factor [Caldilineae bacterium]